MDPQSALSYLTAGRAALALCATADRLGIADITYTTVLHSLVNNSRKGIFPTYNELLHLFSDVSFTPDPASSASIYFNSEFFTDLSRVATIAEFLQAVVLVTGTSVHALSSALELLAPSIEPSWSHFQYNSLVDLFVRKAYVAFASLEFDGLTVLREQLNTYTKGLNTTAVKPTPFPHDVARSAVASLSSGAPVADAHHFDLLTKFHDSSLQSTSTPPSALAHAEYALHLECARRRDSSTATDLLHRAFDLSLGNGTRASPALPPPTSAASSRLLPRRARAPDCATTETAPTERPQYAALALASLSAHTGEFTRVSQALDDAVRIAQHNGDDWCQARALGWLAHTTRAPKRRRELLRRTGDAVALAEDELRTPPPRANGGQASSAARITSIARRVGASTGDLRPGSLLVSSAAWLSYAAAPVALRVARAALAAARSERRKNMPLTACEARSLCAVAALVALEETPARGVALLDDQLRVAGDTPDHKAEFSADMSSSFPELDTMRRARTWLAFRRALARRELSKARGLLADVEAFAVCLAGAGGSPAAAAELQLDAMEAQARLYLARGEFAEACNAAHEMRKMAASWSLPERVVDGSLIAARAHLGSGAGSAALPLAVGAVSLSDKLGLCGAHVKASLVLAEAVLVIQGGSDGVEEAEKALIPVLPNAVGGMGKWMRGYARRLYAQIVMAKFGDKEPECDEFVDAVKGLEDGVKAFEDAEDVEGVRDCCYLLAKARNIMGDIEQRDLMARSFRLNVQLILKRERHQ